MEVGSRRVDKIGSTNRTVALGRFNLESGALSPKQSHQRLIADRRECDPAPAGSPRWVGGRIATHIKVATGAENDGEANPRPKNANRIRKSCLFLPDDKR